MHKNPVGTLPRTAAALSETWWPPCAAPIGFHERLSGGNWRIPAKWQECMTKTTAPPLPDVARLSDKDASCCTYGNRNAGSWLTAVGRLGASCLRTFPVTVTGTSLRTQVGSALQCRRASSSLVRNRSKQSFFPGSRRYWDKGCLPRSPTPNSRLETSSRKASKVRPLRSVPIAAPNLAAWSGSNPEDTVNKQARPKMRQDLPLSAAKISIKWRCI